MNDLVMYIIVNEDLKMTKGKTASQVAHIACDLTNYYLLTATKSERDNYKLYKKTGQPKIILKSSTKEMMELLNEYPNPQYVRVKRDEKDVRNVWNIWCMGVFDAGLTQVEDGSLTVVGFGLMPRNQTPEFIRKMKLL